ncbi:MAG: hypothetical protein J5874_03530 [Oscillospiraceae bacterium]|nr:hypothetical protein [Oscillospiraceae bacterium]
MGFFDKIKEQAKEAVAKATKPANETKKIVFADIPETLEAFTGLKEAELSDPFETAALTVVALCLYPADKELCFKMLEYLKGPAGLSNMEKQFINDRFMDKDYVPRSYFDGATPKNDYTPASPYTISVSSNPYSYDQEGMAKLFLTSGGADSPRPVSLRKAKDGKWYLWDQILLSDIRKPESENPWA